MKKTILLGALLPIVVLLLMCGYYVFVIRSFPSAQEAATPFRPGEFGDMFGAFNAFFTAVAFGVVAISLIISFHELKLLRESQDSYNKQLQMTQEALESELKYRRLSHRLSLVPEFIRLEVAHLKKHHVRECGAHTIESEGIGNLEKMESQCIRWISEFQGLENKRDFKLYSEYADENASFTPTMFIDHLNCFRDNLSMLIRLKRELTRLEYQTRTDG